MRYKYCVGRLSKAVRTTAAPPLAHASMSALPSSFSRRCSYVCAGISFTTPAAGPAGSGLRPPPSSTIPVHEPMKSRAQLTGASAFIRFPGFACRRLGRCGGRIIRFFCEYAKSPAYALNCAFHACRPSSPSGNSFLLGTPANAVEASGSFKSILIERRYCFFSCSEARCCHGGANKGWPTNNVCLGDLRVSHCVPLIRADQGLLWGSFGLQNKGKQGRCTDVRFLGGSRPEGEGFTQIRESNRRRREQRESGES